MLQYRVDEPDPGRGGSMQSRKDSLSDYLDCTDPCNAYQLRRSRITACLPRRVILQQRFSLSVIHSKAPPYGGYTVILTLD